MQGRRPQGPGLKKTLAYTDCGESDYTCVGREYKEFVPCTDPGAELGQINHFNAKKSENKEGYRTLRQEMKVQRLSEIQKNKFTAKKLSI